MAARSRANSAAKLPLNYRRSDFVGVMSELDQKLNGVAEGSIAAHHNATTAAPTGAYYAKGDFVKNTNPVEAGTAGAKYIITGWICVSDTTTVGAFKECRTLTGA